MWTALMYASYGGHSAVVDYLINNGAAIDISDIGGSTALMLAAENGREKVLLQLIAAGADLNVRHNDGYTALMRAVMFDHRGCVAQLLMEGADDTIVNNSGETAFQRAVRNNRPYEVEDAWEGMKAKMTASKFFTVLKSASAANSAPVSDDPPPLGAFFHEVYSSMEIMDDITSFLIGPTSFGVGIDPRFIDKDADVYNDFVIGVVRAFQSLPEGERRDKPIDFFLPFVNEGLSEPWSRERAIIMMKVLAADIRQRDNTNPIHSRETLALILKPSLARYTIEYYGERDLVSLFTKW